MGRPRGKAGSPNPVKGQSRENTPTAPPKRGSSAKAESSKSKRHKGELTPDENGSALSTNEAPQFTAPATIDEYMMALVSEDEESEINSDENPDDENEATRQIVLKIDGVPKKPANLAELRGLLAQLSPEDLLGQLKSWTTITAATPNIGSIDVLKAWMQGDLFKDHLMYLLKNYIFPKEIESGARTRGDDFKTVMDIITETQRHRNRSLVKPKVDRSKWEYCDWLASTLQRVYEANEDDCDGLLDGQNVPDKRKYTIYFAIIRQALSEASKSRRNRLWTTLAMTADEKQELISQFPQLEASFAALSTWTHPGRAIPGWLSQGLLYLRLRVQEN